MAQNHKKKVYKGINSKLIACIRYVCVQISSATEFCAKFTVNRLYDVGTVQPVPVKVYDYYKPGNYFLRI